MVGFVLIRGGAFGDLVGFKTRLHRRRLFTWKGFGAVSGYSWLFIFFIGHLTLL